MTKYLIIGIMACVAAASAQENSAATATTLKWIRRATLVASCGAGVGFDYWALHHVAAEGLQIGGLYGDGKGHPRYGLQFGINGGVCALTAFLQERKKYWSARSEWVWIGENTFSTGLSVWSGLDMLHEADAARAQRVQPGTVAAEQ